MALNMAQYNIGFDTTISNLKASLKYAKVALDFVEKYKYDVDSSFEIISDSVDLLKEDELEENGAANITIYMYRLGNQLLSPENEEVHFAEIYIDAKERYIAFYENPATEYLGTKKTFKYKDEHGGNISIKPNDVDALYKTLREDAENMFEKEGFKIREMDE